MALPAPCHWADTARLCGSETLGQTLGFQLGRTCKYLGTDREALSWVKWSQCDGSAHEPGIVSSFGLVRNEDRASAEATGQKLTRTLFMWALFYSSSFFFFTCPPPWAVQQLIIACGMKVLLRCPSAGWDEGKAVIITVLLTQYRGAEL